ncbi:SCO family protein [Peribacillus deserti]|uniref:Cytochrome c oxidase assembly protein n=1 Tax=Peribacillus deserti TaxID=673318 RepID=A0A2N5M2Z9_9BACI|nr:SCO family protein [Peribacillus deserti]PLT28730.1 cytochrome c oxidase assembly protein [Peribacillus deserti]
MIKKTYKAFIILILSLLVLASCGPEEVPNARNWPVGNFKAADQENKPFTKKDLRGKVWVANFIFTNCTTVCPPMTANMAKLQQELKKEKLTDVQLVSFSIDPEIDSPSVMKSYAKKFNADHSKWHFLTGYSQSFIEKFSADSFHLLVKKPQNEDQVIHGTEFALVDEEGKVIQMYKGNTDFPLEELIKHIKILRKN